MTPRPRKCWAAALLCLAALAAAPGATPADGPPRPADPGGADDVLDLLYLAEGRPYVFRLHVTIDGKPYTAKWAERVEKVFHYLDREGTGALTKEEVALAPSPQQMAQLFHGVPYSTAAFNDGSAFAEMDADGDRKVTPAEFLNYYRRSAGGPAQLVGAAGATASGPLTERLFSILDADKDGKLSRAELAAAERSLHKYDQNDDEIITADELMQVPGLRTVAFQVGAMQAPQRPSGLPLGDAPFILVPREEAPKRVSERLKAAADLLVRYDKDKDGKLIPAEIGVPKEVFDRFDADHDGAWSATELLRWMIFAPDLEATIRLGQVDDKDALLELHSSGPAAAWGLTVSKAGFDALSVGMSDAQIGLVRPAAFPGYGPLTDAVFQGYDQQFQALDKDDRRYITRQQIADGQNPVLYQAFPIIDRDGDGRLTEEELRAWVALAAEAVGCVPTISLADNGRALFEMLDANGDGRLTVRELRGAWARLAPYDHKGEGAIGKDDIPRQFQLSIVGSGADAAVVPQQPQPATVAMTGPQAPARAERGPLWFRKMDVNGDGDVSPREFLGSLEDFRRIDADGDGLISAEEAEAFDAMMRTRKGEK